MICYYPPTLSPLTYNQTPLLRSSFPLQGTLPRVKWAKAMTKVLGVDIPWLSLQPLICPANEDATISYIKFLEQYRISGMEAAVEDAILSKIAGKFLAFGPTLKDAFHELDQDGSGSISYKELVEALNGLNVGLTKPGLYDLMRTLDTNSDNLITYDEFQCRFEVHFNRIKKLGDRDEWAYKKLRQIGAKLFQLAGASDTADKTLETCFEEVDTDKNGHLDTQEFAKFIRERLEMDISEAKLARLMRLIDENGDGVIDYREFVKTFTVFDSGNTQWQQEVLQRLYSTLLKNKTQLRKAFKLFDVNCDGKISAEEFRIGIEALNDTLPAEEQITALQARELFAALRDKDDCIDYEKFLESFAVEVTPQQPEEEEGPVDPRVAEVDALLADDKPTRQIRRVQRQPSSLAMYSAEIRASKN
jgi:calcium-binding protein CML